MATKQKNFLSPQLIFFLSILAGTLAWEVLASFLALGGVVLGLSTGPVGFDAGVLSLYIEVNPGTFLGLFFGYRFGRTVAASGRSRAGGSRARRSSTSRKGNSDTGGAGTGAAAKDGDKGIGAP